jgi:hypothetical protein
MSKYDAENGRKNIMKRIMIRIVLVLLIGSCLVPLVSTPSLAQPVTLVCDHPSRPTVFKIDDQTKTVTLISSGLANPIELVKVTVTRYDDNEIGVILVPPNPVVTWNISINRLTGMMFIYYFPTNGQAPSQAQAPCRVVTKQF